jgi:hypothetical protein
MERCVYKYIHNYLLANCIITPHQSGFTKVDSAINQLLFITNEFGKALDEGKEIRVVFCDVRSSVILLLPLFLTYFLFDKYFFIHDSKEPCIPIDSIFFFVIQYAKLCRKLC